MQAGVVYLHRLRPQRTEQMMRRHFIPYGSYIAECGYISDRRYPYQQTELRAKVTCAACQMHMTNLGDLPAAV
jgi:hypothetical protein